MYKMMQGGGQGAPRGVFGLDVYMCNSGASFLCVHNQPIASPHKPAVPLKRVVQRKNLSNT
jgi:hypothetical protein